MLPEKLSNAEKAYFLSFGNVFGCVVLLEDNWLLVMTKQIEPAEKLQIEKRNGLVLLPAEKSSSCNWILTTRKAMKSLSLTDFQEALKHPTLYFQSSYWVFTVPRYPDNHNPLLPLALQRKLDAMGPREFLTYILNNLTLEERESLMVDERQRLRTFQVDWPHETYLPGITMARAGFYAVMDSDRVQCAFCRGCLHQWEHGDDPLREHATAFNFCRFIKGLDCRNVNYHSSPLVDEDLKNITQFGPQPATNLAASDAALLGISTNRAVNIQYAPHTSRLRTFSRWPASAPIAAQRICDAGFYYTGFDDQVRCFYCDGGIKSWAAADDPWEEHARWFPDCAYLIQKKGLTYIDQVHTRTPANKKCVRQPSNNAENNSVQATSVQTTSEREDMMKVCISFGHNPEIVKKAMVNRPQAEIRDVIEEIYILEEADDVDTDEASVSGQPSFPSDEEPENTGEMRNQMQPSKENANHLNHMLGDCFMCENKGKGKVKATNIALPCGHVIYCDRCMKEELANSQNSKVEVICPYHNMSTGKCNVKLTGTMKIFLA